VSNQDMRKGTILCVALAVAIICSRPQKQSGSNSAVAQERRATAQATKTPALRCELRKTRLGGWWSPSSLHHLHFLLFWQASGVRVYQDWNSWGYYARSFVAKDGKGQTYEIKRRETGFTKNGPSTDALKAGDFLITDIYPCDGSWYVSPQLQLGQSATLTVKARFHIPADEDAIKYRAWTGDLQCEGSDWQGSPKSDPLYVYFGRACVAALNAKEWKYGPPLHD
jgi:hypothetical protein